MSVQMIIGSFLTVARGSACPSSALRLLPGTPAEGRSEKGKARIPTSAADDSWRNTGVALRPPYACCTCRLICEMSMDALVVPGRLWTPKKNRCSKS